MQSPNHLETITLESERLDDAVGGFDEGGFRGSDFGNDVYSGTFDQPPAYGNDVYSGTFSQPAAYGNDVYSGAFSQPAAYGNDVYSGTFSQPAAYGNDVYSGTFSQPAAYGNDVYSGTFSQPAAYGNDVYSGTFDQPPAYGNTYGAVILNPDKSFDNPYYTGPVTPQEQAAYDELAAISNFQIPPDRIVYNDGSTFSPSLGFATERTDDWPVWPLASETSPTSGPVGLFGSSGWTQLPMSTNVEDRRGPWALFRDRMGW